MQEVISGGSGTTYTLYQRLELASIRYINWLMRSGMHQLTPMSIEGKQRPEDMSCISDKLNRGL